jgi:hypothetical protein
MVLGGVLGCGESFVAPALPDLYKTPVDVEPTRYPRDATSPRDMGVALDQGEADQLPPHVDMHP